MPMNDAPRPAKPGRKPQTPQEIRELLCKDAAAVSDSQLIALVLATGTRAPGTPRPRPRGTPDDGQKKSSWSSLELAASLVEEAGGRLCDLVQVTCANAIDWRLYGIGKNIGARLIAAMELAERWRVGAGAALGSARGAASAGRLSLSVFERRRAPSPVELVALVLGVKLPDIEIAQQVMAAFGSLRELIATLSIDAFESTYRKGHIYLRLPGSDLEIERAAFCRLVATVEVARRYRGHPVMTSAGPGSLGEGQWGTSLGLTSDSLEKLLDPATPLDPQLRQILLGQLRSHPELAADFAMLDRLADDAGTDNYQRAAEIHQMFHALDRREGWQHPGEIVGEPVPYRALLRMAQAAIDRATEPPARSLEVKALLENAEREAAALPVATFVDALRGLRLSESGVDRAFEEARRGYLGSGP